MYILYMYTNGTVCVPYTLPRTKLQHAVRARSSELLLFLACRLTRFNH